MGAAGTTTSFLSDFGLSKVKANRKALLVRMAAAVEVSAVKVCGAVSTDGVEVHPPVVVLPDGAGGGDGGGMSPQLEFRVPTPVGWLMDVFAPPMGALASGRLSGCSFRELDPGMFAKGAHPGLFPGGAVDSDRSFPTGVLDPEIFATG